MPFPVCTAFDEFSDYYSSWQSVVLMATFVVFLVSGLAYMLAGVMNHRGVRLWAINQIYEGLATLVLAAFFIGLVHWACFGLDARIFGMELKDCPQDSLMIDVPYDDPGMRCNIFNVASAYLQDFRNSLVTGFIGIWSINMIVAALGSATWSAGTSGVGVQFSLGGGAGLGQASQQMGMGLSGIAVALLLTMAQIQLLRIAEQLFGYLMVAGLILRAFGATRGFGGSLLAIALGFFIIYPLCIVLFYGLLNDQIHNDVKGLNNERQSGSIADYWPLLLGVIAGSAIAGAIGGGIGGTGGAIALSGLIVGIGAAMVTVCPWMISLAGTCAVGALLLPFLTFTILISAVKGLSAALGEEVDVSNLTRLI